ncbi:MAG: pyruvate synthase subunit beta [Nanoarchaeota archaeon]|nr:pyruvate synthase subunit beta [Nanoarchaeota archaeon]
MLMNNLPEKEYFASGHNACRGCGPAIAMRWIAKAAGDNTVIAHATGCMEVISTLYPYTSWKTPWIHSAFENAGAVGSGVEAALKTLYSKNRPNVLMIGGDGSTFDIGFQALSGAIQRKHNFCYVCYDNEAYQNTGYQRSGATPKYARTTTTPYGKVVHGNDTWQKPMPLIIAAHGAKYIATASVSNVVDLYNKVKKGLEIPGPAYVQVQTPCVPGWGINQASTIQVAKLGVETGAYPLYEIEGGKVKMTRKLEKLVPVKKYLELQARFRNLSEDEVKEFQSRVRYWYKYIESLESKGKVFP